MQEIIEVTLGEIFELIGEEEEMSQMCEMVNLIRGKVDDDYERVSYDYQPIDQVIKFCQVMKQLRQANPFFDY